MRWLTVVFFLLGSFLLSEVASAQTSNLAYRVASMSEDIRLLDERIRMLQTQLDEMSRENANLRRTLSSYESDSEKQMARMVTATQLEQTAERTIKQLEARDDVIKSEVIAHVAKLLEKYLPRASTAKPTSKVKTVFPKNYPDTGIPYTVKSGDTLSKIAAEKNSRVDWIQNANQIASAKHLQVGQNLFIPQN